ncbi:MAG: RimK-like ATPgrasp N-terminal domain-containing protein, partial [Gammaproteobacteria bacterium]
MARTLLVVDDLSDWSPYYPSEQVVTFESYLATEQGEPDQRVRVINLCGSYRYLSDGYYCSLLAEARGHHVIPSVRALNDLGRKALYRLQLEDLSETLAKAFKSQNKNSEFTVVSYFGTTPDRQFQDLARLLFERFSCPVLEVTLRFGQQWEITHLKVISYRNLDDAQQTLFADALDRFSKKVWRKGRARKTARYDLAILVNPKEKLPPSNRGALKKFIQAGR